VRNEFPSLRVVVHCGDGKFKSQLKRADTMDAKIALIIGEDEIGRDEVGVKHLADGRQVSIATGTLNEYLRQIFSKE